jgi:hypothetical protein
LIGVATDPDNVEQNISTLHQAELAQPLLKCLHKRLIILVVGSAKRQKANPDRAFGWLRACDKRPRSRAAEERDELAPL